MCSHTCNTEPGFSGAPIFSGNRVVGIHLATITSKINSGAWTWPLFGEPVPSAKTMLRTESSDDADSLQSEEVEAIETEDHTYVRTSSGENRTFENNEVVSKMMRKWKADRDLDPKYFEDSPSNWTSANQKDLDWEVQLDFETKLKELSETIKELRKQQLRPQPAPRKPVSKPIYLDEQFDCVEESVRKEALLPIPRPAENLETVNVRTAIAANAQILQNVDDAKRVLETLNRTANLNLATRVQVGNDTARHASFQLAADITALKQFVEGASNDLLEAAENFELVVLKSDSDFNTQVRWGRYRNKHRESMPPASQATQQQIAIWARDVQRDLDVLRNIPKRIVAQAPPVVPQAQAPLVQEALHNHNAIFSQFGLNFREDGIISDSISPPEQSQVFPNGAQQDDLSPEAPQPDLIKQESTSPTVIPAAPQVSSQTTSINTLEKRISNLQKQFSKLSKKQTPTPGPRKQQTQSPSKKASPITQESTLLPNCGLQTLMSQISDAEWKSLSTALLDPSLIEEILGKRSQSSAP